MLKLRAVIFDVDGTLLHVKGAGMDAIEQAIVSVTGQRLSLEGIRFHGNTDQVIFKQIGELSRGSFSTRQIQAIIECYLDALPGVLLQNGEKHCTEGVPQILSMLSSLGLELGIATGNFSRGAFAKLDALGLRPHFSFGGFGEDGCLRHEILACALEKGGLMAGEAVFIGDTPWDIEAGLKAGTITIGVATGPYSPEELAHAGAHMALSSLAELDMASLLLLMEG